MIVALLATPARSALRSDEIVGASLVVRHALDVGLAALLLTVCAGTGLLALRRLRFPADRPLEMLVFATAAGAGLVATAILILGALSALYTWVLILLLATLTVLAFGPLAELPGVVVAAAVHMRRNGGGRGPILFGTAVFLAVGLFMIAFSVTPPVDWDALMYHLRVPEQFLQAHRIHLPEDNLHVAYVGLVHMLYLPLLAVGSTSGPAVLSALLAVVLGLAVFALSARFFPGPTSSLSLALLWATTSLMLVAMTSRVDVSLALYVFLGHFALMIASDRPDPRERSLYLSLAALMLGFAIGVKYQAAAYVAALAPLALFAVARPRERAGTPWPHLAIALGLFAAAAAPWILKNLALLDAPFYPFFTDRMVPPWLARLYGSPELPTSVGSEVFRALAHARTEFNLRDLIWAPGRLTVESEGTFYFMSPILALLPLWVFLARDRALASLFLPAAAFVLIVVFPFPATNLRYLIPAAAPLTIVAVEIGARLARRWLSTATGRVVLLLIAAGSSLPCLRVMSVWLSTTGAPAHVVGAKSAHEYLTGYPMAGFPSYYTVARAVNRNLDEHDARVLMLFEARGHYFRPEVLQDNVLANWASLEPRARSSCLRETSITHVLVNTGALAYYVGRGVDPGTLRWESFRDFARRCLSPVYRGPGFTVFELPAEPPGT